MPLPGHCRTQPTRHLRLQTTDTRAGRAAIRKFVIVPARVRGGPCRPRPHGRGRIAQRRPIVAPLFVYVGGMDIALQYFDGCPHWHIAEERLRAAMDATATHTPISYVRVETDKEADRLQFHGSPTILIDGHDPFEAPGQAIGLACRLYRTPAGLAGAPTTEQLTEVLAEYHRH